MNKITSWIKGHQIIAFVILTFAITWGLGFSYSAVLNKGIVLLFPLASVATGGPRVEIVGQGFHAIRMLSCKSFILASVW